MASECLFHGAQCSAFFGKTGRVPHQTMPQPAVATAWPQPLGACLVLTVLLM